MQTQTDRVHGRSDVGDEVESEHDHEEAAALTGAAADDGTKQTSDAVLLEAENPVLD